MLFRSHVDKDIKMQGWERKSILRNTIGKQLPDSIMNAPKKGFGIPLREWFKGGAFDEYLNQNLKTLNTILDANTISSIVNDNNTGKKDNGNFIWTMMMLNNNIK